MVLIVIIMVIASRPRAGIHFCPSSLPWPLMGGPLTAFCQVLLRHAAIPTDFPPSLQPPPTWGQASSRARSLAEPSTDFACPCKIFEKGTSYQTPFGFPLTLALKLPCVWPVVLVACPFGLSLSPHLGHTASEEPPLKGT